MLKSNLCYSNGNARRMKDRKKAIKVVRASLKDGIYLLTVVLIVASFFSKIEINLKGVSEAKADGGLRTIEVIKEVKEVKIDERVTKLQKFLESKGSPLASYSQLIVEEADKNDIGYTWITGISCIESACGLKLPQGSHNAWGLGGSNFMYFKSWEESIKYMSKLIGTNYKHDMLQGIKRRYCPESDGCNSNWASIVASASKEISGK